MEGGRRRGSGHARSAAPSAREEGRRAGIDAALPYHRRVRCNV